MQTPRAIACTIYPDVQVLDVTGPLQVFASANVELQRQGRPAGYSLHLLADAVGPVACSAGFSLLAEAAREDQDPARFDTVLVPG
ncbi:GlxA family transcriptional regulator, partial [Variovorax sp. CT11-76]